MTIVSHVAYSDESYHNRGRYRSIAVVTSEAERSQLFSQALRELLDDSEVSEFKFQKLRQARYRFAAQKIVDFVIERALCDTLRVDVLIWDTEDSRHRMQGRDDVANLQRMYYHLLNNVLKRWPGDNSWGLYPDRNSALNWETVSDFLDVAGVAPASTLQEPALFHIRLRHEFHIEEVEELDSKENPLCQVADFLAGMSVFSRHRFNAYCCWKERQHGQLRLFPDDPPVCLSNSDGERCRVLDYMNTSCKDHGLGVSLKTRQGLWTPDPNNPINFWFYEPQHPEDKAPARSSD
jgi:hypothetical protein